MSDRSHTNGKDHYNEEDERTAALNRLRSAASVTIDPELFEKLYLSPPNKVKGDLRKTFGNPTPMYAPSPCNCDCNPNSMDQQWHWRFLTGGNALVL